MLASKVIHTEHINVHKTIKDRLKRMEFSKFTMQQHELCITRTTTMTSVHQSSSIKTLDEIQK